MIGYHYTGALNDHLDATARQRPAAGLVLDPSEGSDVALKSRGVKHLVARVYRPDEEIAARIEADPVGAARWAVDVMREPMRTNPGADWWQFSNEVCQTSAALIRKLNTFSIAYVDELARLGKRAAIGGFSVGNPDLPAADRMALWREFYPAMAHAKARGGVLLLHAYGAPQLFGPDADWYLYRYEKQVLPRLPAELRDMPYIYGEYGVDLGVVGQPERGWKTGYSGNYPAYAADLQRAAAYLATFPQCLGACLYVLGGVNDRWLDFDVRGAPLDYMSRLAWPAPASLPAPTPTPEPSPPTPPPPTGGSTVTIHPDVQDPTFPDVFYRVKPAADKSGGYYRVKSFTVERSGQVIVIGHVTGGSSPAWHFCWPDGKHRALDGEAVAMGPGAKFTTPDGGPHWIYFGDDPAKSESVRNLGLPVGEHTIFRATGEWVPAGSTTPPPSPPPAPGPVPPPPAPEPGSVSWAKIAYAAEAMARQFEAEGLRAEAAYLLASDLYVAAKARRDAR